ncbi:MAG: DUF3048 domain-containing protein [Anaerolineae bacterium]|nr:DUF3048 domain-containing protein [Anaerolineae bacterium]
MSRYPRLVVTALLMPFMLAACEPAPQALVTLPPPDMANTTVPTLEPVTPGAAADEPAEEASGLDENVNPLTGLPVSDPAVLERRPLVIKVSNESPEVRPQSGLSFADHVWEYQMEGWGQTRYTAIYLSQSPERVGSVRSTRLIDVDVLVPMYGGLLVTSGASSGVTTALKESGWWERVFREEPDGRHLVRIPDIPVAGTDFYHSLFAVPAQVWAYADRRRVNEPVDLSGLIFAAEPPAGGEPASRLAMDYPGRGPVHRWVYDDASGRWLSSTEDQRARAPEAIDIDLLTGEQLAFDNVVILFAEHYLADFIEDQPNQLLSVGILLHGEGDGFLLRDRRAYAITWEREGDEMIRLLDTAGDPIPLRPGTTWFSTSVAPDAAEFSEFAATLDFTP